MKRVEGVPDALSWEQRRNERTYSAAPRINGTMQEAFAILKRDLRYGVSYGGMKGLPHSD